jgi:colicin import membrane protein
LPLIVFNPSLVAGNPAVEVGVELAPDGTIVNRKVLKSSGDAAWDKAVLRAIDDAQTLPKDDDGKVPKQVRLTFKPKD